jgi:predicted acylesterase/phospholipase RssA
MGIQALGALKHLEQAGFYSINNIKTVYATSAGAIVALLIALKFDWEAITDYIVLRPWHETYGISVSQIFDSYAKKGIFGQAVIETFFKPFFKTNDLPLDMTMADFYAYSQIELHFYSLELNGFEMTDVSYKTYPDVPVIRAVQMSCAIPMIISPVCFSEKCFVDGGIINNYPLKFCLQEGHEPNDIFGIRNMYEKKDADGNRVDTESTILDYIIHFISKLIQNASDKNNVAATIPYELQYDARFMSFDNMKEALFSSDVRRDLLQKGADAAGLFLAVVSQQKGTEDEVA